MADFHTMTPNGNALNAFYGRTPGIQIQNHSRFGELIIAGDAAGGWAFEYPKTATALKSVRRKTFDGKSYPEVPGGQFPGHAAHVVRVSDAELFAQGLKALTGDNLFILEFDAPQGATLSIQLVVRQKNLVYA